MTYPAPIHEGPRLRKRWGEPCALCGFGERRAVHLLPLGATEASAPDWWHPFAPRAQARSAAEADLEWLLRYLQAHYSLGLPDIGGRICIGGACGATGAEAVRKARVAFEAALAESAWREIGA